MEITMNDRRTTAGVFAAYFVIFMTAFFVLVALFEFPDVLREEPAYRFSLFQASQRTIVLAYYAMVVTGILQIFMAVSLFQVTHRSGMLPLFALVSGVSAGIFQVLGFLRWVALIPLLSSSLQAGTQSADTVFALEGLMNGYLPRGVRIMMGASGLALALVALEALGGPFAGIGVFSVALWGLFYTFIVVFVAALLKRGNEGARPTLHWGIWLGAWLFWLANVIPAFLG